MEHQNPGHGGPRLSTLPNGLEVGYRSRAELEHIYADIFERRVYVRHGITLAPGACVFDVGANIGLFTLFVAQSCPDARIFSFEPAPPLFEVLRMNAARYAPNARLFPCGVSHRARTARLTFYPESSGMSSFYADRQEESEVLEAILRNEARQGDAGAEAVLRYQDEYLDERLRHETFECPLVSLSQVLREHAVERVDLLKIDVQKSELDVVRGLTDDDWPKIDQVAIEVHDVDGRVRDITRRLEARGFTVTDEQDDLYGGSNIHNHSALRPTRRRAEPTAADALQVSAQPARTALRRRAEQQRRSLRRPPAFPRPRKKTPS